MTTSGKLTGIIASAAAVTDLGMGLGACGESSVSPRVQAWQSGPGEAAAAKVATDLKAVSSDISGNDEAQAND